MNIIQPFKIFSTMSKKLDDLTWGMWIVKLIETENRMVA